MSWNGDCPAQTERILNSGEVVEVRRWWAWQGSRKQSLEPHLHPCLPDLNCAMIDIQIVLLSRWMPFSFQHTELEATKKKKKVGLGQCAPQTVLLWMPSPLPVPVLLTSGLS